MCSNTKQRIADAVEELISTQPGSRVTVQQVMDRLPEGLRTSGL